MENYIITILSNIEFILIPFIVLYFYLDKPFKIESYDITKFSITILNKIAINCTFFYLLMLFAIYVLGFFISFSNDPIALSFYSHGCTNLIINVFILLITYEMCFYFFFVKRYKYKYLQVLIYNDYYKYKYSLNEDCKENLLKDCIRSEIDDYIERVTKFRLSTLFLGILSIIFSILTYYSSSCVVDTHYSVIEKYYPGITTSGKYTKKELADIANYIHKQKNKNKKRYEASEPIIIKDTTNNIKQLLENIEEVVKDRK